MDMSDGAAGPPRHEPRRRSTREGDTSTLTGDGGLYILVLRLSGPVVLRVGALGRCELPAGWGLYVGSAKRHLRRRVERHLARRKAKRWHIDYLTTCAKVRRVGALLLPGYPGTECRLSQRVGERLRAAAVIGGFGASDCRGGCPAHFWLTQTEVTPRELMKAADSDGEWVS